MNKEIHQRLLKFKDGNAYSLSDLVKLFGYSSGTWSAYLQGCYKGDVNKLEGTLSEYFANLDAASELASSEMSGGYVDTSISQAVYQTIRICHLKGGLAIECGDPGIGKTMAAKRYTQDYPTTSIYVAANPCFATTSAFLRLLCSALGLRTGNKSDMYLRIKANLAGERIVLIIDEAQQLPIKTVDMIRSFYDENPNLGICFIGNLNLAVFGGKNAEDFAQVKNRTRDTEIRHTRDVQSDDIRKLFPNLPGEKETALLLSVARSAQALRGAANVYSNALDNNNLTYSGLLAMCKQMKIVI